MSVEEQAALARVAFARERLDELTADTPRHGLHQLLRFGPDQADVVATDGRRALLFFGCGAAAGDYQSDTKAIGMIEGLWLYRDLEPVIWPEIPRPALPDKCKTCNGSGVLACDECNGSGRCSQCADGTCHICEGDPSEQCNICMGSGKPGWKDRPSFVVELGLLGRSVAVDAGLLTWDLRGLNPTHAGTSRPNYVNGPGVLHVGGDGWRYAIATVQSEAQASYHVKAWGEA